jgi:hypothetical protein
MFVCCDCCVLSGRGLCDELITRPEESYRLWCVVVCDLETSRMRRPWPALGRSATEKKAYSDIRLFLTHPRDMFRPKVWTIIRQYYSNIKGKTKEDASLLQYFLYLKKLFYLDFSFVNETLYLWYSMYIFMGLWSSVHSLNMTRIRGANLWNSIFLRFINNSYRDYNLNTHHI